MDLATIGRLDFEEPDRLRFPCLDLAFRALEGSEEAPAVLNAANEVSVAAFLSGDVPFSAIAICNASVLNSHLAERAGVEVTKLEDVLVADAWARERARIELGCWSLNDRIAGTAETKGA